MRRVRTALMLASAVTVGCSELQADDLLEATTSYSASLVSATQYINDELSGFRSGFRKDRLDGRLNQLRYQLRTEPDIALSVWQKPPDKRFLLCAPQRQQVQYAAALVPLASVGKTTERLTSKPDATGLMLIIQTFGRDYEARPPDATVEQIGESAKTLCEEDLALAGELLDGTTEIGQKEAAFLAKAVALLELAEFAYKAAVAVGEKVASAVDERARRAALKAFLENPQTQEAFKTGIAQLREGMALKSRSRRLVIAENYLLLHGDLESRWKKVAALPADERKTPDAVDDAVARSLESHVARLLALGTQYDEEFDRRALPALTLVEKSFDQMVAAAGNDRFDLVAAVALFDDVKEIFDELAKQRKALGDAAENYQKILKAADGG